MIFKQRKSFLRKIVVNLIRHLCFALCSSLTLSSVLSVQSTLPEGRLSECFKNILV